MTTETVGMGAQEAKMKNENLPKDKGKEWICEQTIQEDFASLSKESSDQEMEEKYSKEFLQIMESEPPEINRAKNLKTIAIQKKSATTRNMEKAYHIHEQVAEGGMGVIYKVWDHDLERELAMKVWKTPAQESQAILNTYENFISEARITARLEHPNIIPVHDMGLMQDEKIYFTMKLISGEDVFSIINKLFDRNKDYLEKYNLHALLIIFRKVCDAAAFAHFRHIIHRDIKPQNIMVGKHGEVLLMDWGIAKVMAPGQAQEEKQGKIMGTPHYMSPEQSKGDNKSVDNRSDIYLLGATLYHMLTLHPPHMGKDIMRTLYFIQKGNIIPPHERNRSRQIPLELSRIVMKCLSLKKEDRYQTVEELCIDIDNFMSGTIVSKPVSFKKGDFLMKQHEEGENAYTILSGSAEVFQNISGKSILLTTLEEGSVVGEMGLISSTKRSADVVAKEDMEVLVIDKKLLQDSLDKMPPWLGKIVSTLSSRLQIANNNIHPLKIGDPVYHVLKHLGIMSSYLFHQATALKIEEMPIDYQSMLTEIAVTLCIPEEKVKNVLEILFQTNLCERLNEQQFQFKNFLFFCHVLDFLRNTLEIEKTIDWIGKLPPLDQEQNILRCQIAAKFSKEVREFLLQIPTYAKYIENL